jgi:heme/copper-type cytochrome/quinol oxidase subunit 4
MTAQLFLVYLAFVVAVVIGISAAYLPRRTTFAIIMGLAIWLVYVGLLSFLGYMRDPSLRPPGIVWVVGPVVLFVVFLVGASNIGARVAAAIPLWLILGFESFRIGVEFLVHRLWVDGLAPKLLTYEGGNVDMVFGLSAPIIAWIATTGRLGLRLAMGWNVLGLLSLANVAASSVLTGPLKLISTEVPNVAMGLFPYTFIPGFLAPLAVTLHVLAIRPIAARLRTMRSPASDVSASTS